MVSAAAVAVAAVAAEAVAAVGNYSTISLVDVIYERYVRTLDPSSPQTFLPSKLFFVTAFAFVPCVPCTSSGATIMELVNNPKPVGNNKSHPNFFAITLALLAPVNPPPVSVHMSHVVAYFWLHFPVSSLQR